MSNIASHAILLLALAVLLSAVWLWLSGHFGYDEPGPHTSSGADDLRP